MRYEDDTNKLPRGFVVLEIILLIVFTVMDAFGWFPIVAASLKLVCIALCFLFSLSLLFSINAENDRILLMFSLAFTLIAATLVLFTDLYIHTAVAFCIVQEFHAARIFSMKKSLVRIDGRIDSFYRTYKVYSQMLITNLFLLVLALIPLLVDLFIELPMVTLLCTVVFYFFCSAINLLRLLPISRDIRLLDDMRPLRAYFAGLLISFLCSIFLLVLFLPDCLGISLWPDELLHIGAIVSQPLYLVGIIALTFSGYRRQEFYT